jgi:hypothetical protein
MTRHRVALFGEGKVIPCPAVDTLTGEQPNATGFSPSYASGVSIRGTSS